MKKLFSIITLTAVVAVVMVSCKPNSSVKEVVYVDTAGFAQFQAWKIMNENLEQNKAYASNTSKRSYNNTSSSNKSGSMTSETSNNAKTSKKRGWSKAAKYAAIGGGTGVVLGAVINKKNRVAGGVVGGILGGGIGYGIGRSKDKKEGRY